MADYVVTIHEIIRRTHDVDSYRIDKPAGFLFEPGQATDFSLLAPGWENEKRPFTFTSIPADDYLEFTIKHYDDHEGLTHRLRKAKRGDACRISDAWGAIHYQGAGVFIAGGAGITPFLSIFRDLYSKGKIRGNQLLYSNKTEADIILRQELQQMLGNTFINTITAQKDTDLRKGRIDRDFLLAHAQPFNRHFYVCGPEAFNESILRMLQELGAKADSIVWEK